MHIHTILHALLSLLCGWSQCIECRVCDQRKTEFHTCTSTVSPPCEAFKTSTLLQSIVIHFNAGSYRGWWWESWLWSRVALHTVVFIREQQSYHKAKAPRVSCLAVCQTPMHAVSRTHGYYHLWVCLDIVKQAQESPLLRHRVTNQRAVLYWNLAHLWQGQHSVTLEAPCLPRRLFWFLWGLPVWLQFSTLDVLQLS